MSRQTALETFQTGKELTKLVPGFRVELMIIPIPRFSITGGEIDDRKKKIIINLWQGATRKDALAILAHEYAHIKPGTTEIERGLSEVNTWRRGFEYAKKWGATEAYLEHADGLANFYERKSLYPRIVQGVREWLKAEKPRAVPQTTPKEPFVEIGERVRFVGSSKSRRGDWPEDSWLESGVAGKVIEYHPPQPSIRVPPYAVVRWDLRGGCDTVIDVDDEGKRWGRIDKIIDKGGRGMRILDVRGKDTGHISKLESQWEPRYYRCMSTQTPHETTYDDIKEFRKRAEEEGAVIIFISNYGQSAYIPIKQVVPATQPSVAPQTGFSQEDNLLKYYKVPPSAF